MNSHEAYGALKALPIFIETELAVSPSFGIYGVPVKQSVLVNLITGAFVFRNPPSWLNVLCRSTAGGGLVVSWNIGVIDTNWHGVELCGDHIERFVSLMQMQSLSVAK